MNHEVKVFEIEREARPGDHPRVLEGFSVVAETIEEARAAALARLLSDGRSVRSISFLEGGGLAAVVYAEAPAPLRVKGGRR